MRILAFETATEWCSVALLAGDELLFHEYRLGPRASDQVLPMAMQLLADAGLTVGGLSGIAFGAGPGSFTGLRIACSIAQGLAFGADLPLVPVSTLAALSAGEQSAQVIACLDARQHEVYFAAYRNDSGTPREVVAPVLARPDSVPVPDGRWCGAGSGFAVYGEILRRRLGDALVETRPESFPHARQIARLAAPVLAAGGGVTPENAAPIYVRDKVALRIDER